MADDSRSRTNMRLYCITCKTTFCLDCFVDRLHHNHQYKNLEDVLIPLQGLVGDQLNIIYTKLDRTGTLKTNIELSSIETKTRKSKILSDLQKQRDDAIKRIKKKYANAANEIEKADEYNESRIASKRQEIRDLENKLSVLQTTNQELLDCSKVEFVRRKDMIEKNDEIIKEISIPSDVDVDTFDR